MSDAASERTSGTQSVTAGAGRATPGAGPHRGEAPTGPAEAPVWLDVRGAAARAIVSPATILREARARRLTAYKVGAGRKLWRFRPGDVDAWVTRSTTLVLVGPGPSGGHRA